LTTSVPPGTVSLFPMVASNIRTNQSTYNYGAGKLLDLLVSCFPVFGKAIRKIDNRIRRNSHNSRFNAFRFEE
jgi:hypothetical protein